MFCRQWSLSLSSSWYSGASWPTFFNFSGLDRVNHIIRFCWVLFIWSLPVVLTCAGVNPFCFYRYLFFRGHIWSTQLTGYCRYALTCHGYFVIPSPATCSPKNLLHFHGNSHIQLSRFPLQRFQRPRSQLASLRRLAFRTRAAIRRTTLELMFHNPGNAADKKDLRPLRNLLYSVEPATNPFSQDGLSCQISKCV